MKNKQIVIEEMLMVKNIMSLEKYVFDLWCSGVDADLDDYLNFRLEKIKNPNYSYKDVPVFNEYADGIKNALSDIAITFDSWFIEKSSTIIEYALEKSFDRFVDEQISNYAGAMKIKLLNEFGEHNKINYDII